MQERLPGNAAGVAQGSNAARAVQTAAAARPGAFASAREQQTEISLGVTGQAGLRFDLDDQQRWFLDLWGKYSYVQDFSISDGLNSADIDASAWSYGVGLGYRF